MLIFAIDDEESVLHETADMIREAVPGSEIRSFHRGTAALDAIRQGDRPDVVFSDIEMPGISGLAFAVRLKEISPETRIVFTTGYAQYAVEAFRIKAHGYLLKPLTVQALRDEMAYVPAMRKLPQERLVVRCFGYFDVYWQGKPVINYEGRYCGLWTGEFGSRMQGWVSYLSGMYGYGWGAQDTWSYLNSYDEDKDTDDGVEVITAARKTAATWRDALASPCGGQMGAMRRFLEDADWYDLNPRFDNKAYFAPAQDVFACCAGNRDNDVIALYFYSFSDPAVAQRPNAKGRSGFATGTVGRLSLQERYGYRWFDPIGGAYIAKGTFTASPEGTWAIGPRPRDTDLALLIRKIPLEKNSEKEELST